MQGNPFVTARYYRPVLAFCPAMREPTLDHQPTRIQGPDRRGEANVFGVLDMKSSMIQLKTVGLILLSLTSNGTCHAMNGDRQRVRNLLNQACAKCHAIGRSGQSPHADAPPFRFLGENKLYDEDFGQRLQEGLSSIHADMPTFRFSRRDAARVINYLRAIQDHRNK